MGARRPASAWLTPDGLLINLPSPVARANCCEGPGFRLFGGANAPIAEHWFRDRDYPAGWAGALQAALNAFAAIAPTLTTDPPALAARRERRTKGLALGFTDLSIGWQGARRRDGRRAARVRVKLRGANRSLSLGVPEELTDALLALQLRRAAALRLLYDECRWLRGGPHLPRFTPWQMDSLSVRYRRAIRSRLRVPSVEQVCHYLETRP
jgi:hypothetical protein